MKREVESLKTVRGDQTRALILETALELFRTRGYDDTTMRVIAAEAGVALGNAYYYFKSKEHLVQAFYERLHQQQLAAAQPILERERKLKSRLLGVLRNFLEIVEPYHRFSGNLFKTAADPESPLNPFSRESEAVRSESVQLFEDVVNGSDVRIAPDLRRELPYLLWLFHLGIVVFWIHDYSPGRKRTQKLMEQSVDLIVRLIRVAGSPWMRSLRKKILGLIGEARGVS